MHRLTDTPDAGQVASTAIKKKKSLLVQKAEDAKKHGRRRDKLDAEMRIRFLDELKERYETEIPQAKKLFVSYAKRSAQDKFELVNRMAVEMDFTVITGFDGKKDENVLQAVLKRISECTVFLSIVTQEYQIGGNNTLPGKALPSVWLMEEKGMALEHRSRIFRAGGSTRDPRYDLPLG